MFAYSFAAVHFTVADTLQRRLVNVKRDSANIERRLVNVKRCAANIKGCSVTSSGVLNHP
jgi:hypothetical protein